MTRTPALLDLIAAESFRPFRITMEDGRSFDIRHPEMIYIGRTNFRVHAATGPEQPEQWHDESLAKIEAVEPLEPSLPHVGWTRRTP
jgi:hypothetical protein